MDEHPETEITTTDPITAHISSYDSVTNAVISAIADARDCELKSLDPVYEAIDLEALDDLYTNSNHLAQTDLQITFTVADCKVILYGDGRIISVPVVNCYPDRSGEGSLTTETEEEV